jgi:3-hydroxyisobutyrate dehydrogenase-like beta-hydroxyacid dehydrogenase
MTVAEGVGVIGLGLIGTAWAENYEADGKLSASWNRSAKPSAPRWVADPAEVARRSSVIHVVVAGPPAVSSVLDALLDALEPRHLVLQSSTIDGTSAAAFAERVTARGAAYVEAPFTGSLPAARARKTIFFLGGELSSVSRAEAVLTSISALRHHIGGVSQAAALKLSFNVLAGVLMQGLCESLAAARHSGISDQVYFDCMRGTSFWSDFLALKEPKLRQADFEPQFSVQHLHKDLTLAADMVGSLELPLVNVVRDRLTEMQAEGLASADMSALIRKLA